MIEVVEEIVEKLWGGLVEEIRSWLWRLQPRPPQTRPRTVVSSMYLKWASSGGLVQPSMQSWPRPCPLRTHAISTVDMTLAALSSAVDTNSATASCECGNGRGLWLLMTIPWPRPRPGSSGDTSTGRGLIRCKHVPGHGSRLPQTLARPPQPRIRRRPQPRSASSAVALSTPRTSPWPRPFLPKSLEAFFGAPNHDGPTTFQNPSKKLLSCHLRSTYICYSSTYVLVSVLLR